MTTALRAFAAPADLASDVRAQAEALWTSTLQSADEAYVNATDRRLAELLNLADSDGHDELARCEAPGCDAWHYADEGGTVAYDSGRRMQMCAVHAVPDDPGARVYPGKGLEAAWRDTEQAEISARIRATGRPW